MVRAVTILFFFFITLLTTIEISFCDRNSDEVCIESERQALVSFKQDLTDPSNRLSSWAVEKDCCKWAGVVCDNITSHVKELHLQTPYGEIGTEAEYEAFTRSMLGGKINSALLNLKHLSHLDLSYNDFEGIQIPIFIGSLGSLRYLNFSEAGFGGMIPYQLENLTNLRSLGLQGNSYVENLGWISGLSSLEHLDLSGVNLSTASDWLQALNMLPSLMELHLSGCGLDRISSLPHVNFTSLSVLDISRNYFYSSVHKWVFSLTNLIFLDLSVCFFFGPIPSDLRNMTDLTRLYSSVNNFNSTIPNWLYSFSRLEIVDLSENKLQGIISSAVGNLTSVTALDLYGNQLDGAIPRSLGNLYNLEAIDLSGNQLDGAIPKSLGNLYNLEAIDLSGNSISGPIPESLWNLSKLGFLGIEDNLLEGVVQEVHFANLTNLKYLFASRNQLALKASSDWIPRFQLDSLGLGSWHLGPEFPFWLKSQKHLGRLDLSCTGISDTIPTWFWNLSSQYRYLNLSHNQIHGEIPYIPGLEKSDTLVYLSSNQFTGPLPRISSNITELDLSNNSFSGNLSRFLCDRTDEPHELEILHLGENHLSGEIPDCWMKWQSLNVINLGNNNFTGNIPSSMRYLGRLQSLHLRNNSLSGELPHYLWNLTWLTTLDLGVNEFV